jgi:hypothetical protein
VHKTNQHLLEQVLTFFDISSAIGGLLPVVLHHPSGVKIGPKGPPHPRRSYSLQPLHARSTQPIADAVPTGWVGKRSLDTTSLHPRSQSSSPTTSLVSSAGSGTPKTRRMVYGWGPKSFESGQSIPPPPHHSRMTS